MKSKSRHSCNARYLCRLVNLLCRLPGLKWVTLAYQDDPLFDSSKLSILFGYWLCRSLVVAVVVEEVRCWGVIEGNNKSARLLTDFTAHTKMRIMCPGELPITV